MKKFYLIIILALTGTIVNSQNCFWAKKVSGLRYDEGKGIAINKTGNIYVTGYFESPTLSLGDSTLYNQSEPGYSYCDLLIAKYDASGNLLWAKQFGGVKNDASNSLAIDSSGNLYITGCFTGDTLIMGSDILLNDNSPYPDFFVAKLDSAGNALWAKNAGGITYTIGNGIAVDTSGNVYVTGEMQSDSMTLDTITLHMVSTSTNFFIAKYDQAGNVIWAKNTGGRFGDPGIAITTDLSGNAYAIGTFSSDSISFDNVNYLYNNCTANGDFYVVKYDQNGNALWAQNHTGGNIAYGYGITSDGNYVYITGAFKGNSMTLGGITINNYNSDLDVFLVKYNSNGNVLWAKSAGGNNEDYGRNIATDHLGNVYVIGHFRSDSIFFDNVKLYNAGPSLSYTMSYLFIAKYDASGNPQWAKRAQSTFSSQEYIVASGENNVFFTGAFYNDSAYFGEIVLNNSGYDDMYVAHLYSFSSAISSSLDVTCNGDSTGTASVGLTGGFSPFIYTWSNGDSLQTITNLTAGNYAITVTDINGCPQTSSVTITEPPPDFANICLVTVDSLSLHNIIVWDKTLFTRVDSFIVYREISTNNYQPVARIPYDSLSQFIDTVRTLYFPNTGDPNTGTYRYKIQCHDTCGKYSEFSPYHNTIYFMYSSGMFTWPQLYTIENGANPVGSYVLMRDDSSNGNWHAIGSVAGTQQFIIDPQYSQYQNTASWRIKTMWSISCTPTFKYSTGYNASLSNVYTNVHVGLNENSFDDFINIYPNPANDEIEISLAEKSEIEILNIEGQLLKSLNVNANHATIDVSAFAKGMYFVKVKNGNGIAVKKFVKE